MDMQKGRHIANHNIGVFNKFPNGNGIHNIDFAKGAPFSSIFLSNFLSICNDITSNMDMILDSEMNYFRSPEHIVNNSFRHEPRTKEQNPLFPLHYTINNI